MLQMIVNDTFLYIIFKGLYKLVEAPTPSKSKQSRCDLSVSMSQSVYL